MASACSIVMANDGGAGMLGSNTGRPALHTRASTCILVSLSLLCALVLVICGVLVVREWALTRTFDATFCTVRNVTYSSNDHECSYCTSGAKDSKARMEKAAEGGSPNMNLGGGSICVPAFYPCVYVVVQYGVNSSRGIQSNHAKLYESSAQATGRHRECSFSVCHKSRQENARLVEKFAQKWRAKTNAFRCFYDTRDPHRVIVHKNYTIFDVVNCMLWPSVVIIVCIGVFLKLESKRRGLTFCGRVEEEDKNKPTNKQIDKTKRCNHPTYHTDSPKVIPTCHHYHRHHHHTSLTRLHIPSIDDVSKDGHNRAIKGSKDHRFKQLKSSNPEEDRDVKLTSSTPNIHSLKVDTVDIERMKKLAKKHLGGKAEHETQDYSNCYNDVNGDVDLSEQKSKNKYIKNNNNNNNNNDNNNRHNRKNNRSSTIDWADQEPRNKKHHHHHHHHHPHLHHRNVSSSLDEDKSEINCKNNFHSNNNDDKHNNDNNNDDSNNNSNNNTSDENNRSVDNDEENESSKLLENGGAST